MATTHDPHLAREHALSQGARRFRWTSEQYYRLAEQGFFASRHVELIGGEIWQMTTNPPHSIASELLHAALLSAFGSGHRLRIQQPLDLGRRNQPEPDLVVLQGSPRDSVAHPTTALFVVETSDATLARDRTVKAHLYARAGIPEYWVLNLADRQLEVLRAPAPQPGGRGRFIYRDVSIVPATGTISPLAAPASVIAVVDVLP